MSTTDCTTKRSYTHLTAGQRGKIQAWLSDGHSMAEIARRIGVHRSSISREIKRGSVQQVKKVNGKLVYFQDYFDETAQNLAEKRREVVYCLKLEKVSESFLTAFTEAMLAKPRIHSVDTFIHAYKQDNPDELVPSTKTMYTYIHQGLLAVKPIDLPRAVRLKPKVKKRTSTKKHLGTSIEERPEEINNRSEFGHWEIDSVLGLKTAGEPSILTLVERKTRYAITVYLAGKKAEFVNEAVSQLLKDYPIKSITADNGAEFATLSQLEGVQVYYAHAYSSHERGTNENFNGLLREFIPKGKSLKFITAESLATATSAINQRPRRLLGYQSAKTLLGLAQAA
ncbi:IS30 family transposase [Streptococcus pneumoniae]